MQALTSLTNSQDSHKQLNSDQDRLVRPRPIKPNEIAICDNCGGENFARNMKSYFGVYLCDFCLLDPDQPIPYHTINSDLKAKFDAIEASLNKIFTVLSDISLYQMCAANSGKNGNRTLLTNALAEIELRQGVQDA